jgi:hypothetical protein
MASDPVIIKAYADPNAEEAKEFFRQLGMCVGTWAFIDRRLYQIFHHARGMEQQQSALKFYSKRAFGRRLEMTDDALKALLPKETYDSEWKPIFTETTNLSYTRNILAHHPTKRLGTAKDGKPLDIYSIHIEPYERILNYNYPGLLGKDELGIEDLIQHQADLEALEGKLHTFAWHTGAERAAAKTRSAKNSADEQETPTPSAHK